MRRLFNTRAEVLRMSGQMVNGVPKVSWDKVATLLDPQLGQPGELMCRLDLTFLRPGKDQPAPAVAGRAQDRVGVMFFAADTQLKANDRIHCVDGPVEGTFEIRNKPDPAVGLHRRHHFEVQVIEVAQSADNGFTLEV
jgi:hypothetical protein